MSAGVVGRRVGGGARGRVGEPERGWVGDLERPSTAGVVVLAADLPRAVAAEEPLLADLLGCLLQALLDLGVEGPDRARPLQGRRGVGDVPFVAALREQGVIRVECLMG